MTAGRGAGAAEDCREIGHDRRQPGDRPPAAKSAGVHRQDSNRGLGDDVVDGDVDSDVVETGFGAQVGDGLLLDFAGDGVELGAVVGGDGEADHGGAAKDTGRGVGVVVPEGCFSGWAGGCAVGAAAEGGPDSGNGAGGFAHYGGYHPTNRYIEEWSRVVDGVS